VSEEQRRVSIVTLGCARNEVDSEELAGRLGAGGWQLAQEDEESDVIVINTCGFIDSAKKDSIDTVLAAADTGKKVVAVGCLAERYGAELAESLPEADAVLGFDSYADIAARLDDVAAGRPITPHVPSDRRKLLPVSPAARQEALHAHEEIALPGHAWLPSATSAGRTRLDTNPVAYLKLASGCDRRCAFCAIPTFRGSFVSRHPGDVTKEAEWLAGSGVRELVLVSENSTSYGKDLGEIRLLEALLPRLAKIDGIERIRVAYLQPAELRPGLIEVIATTPKIAPYFDLSFQHSSEPVLRRMRRYGTTDTFLAMLEQVRQHAPEAGARSNVIMGFPGESEQDVAELERFLEGARLDAIGVFGYSDEDGTEAVGYADKHEAEVIAERVSRISALADELVSQRAEDRIGSTVEVLVESVREEMVGRAAHQGPEVDGTVTIMDAPAGVRVGHFLRATVIDSEGADLIARSEGEPW